MVMCAECFHLFHRKSITAADKASWRERVDMLLDATLGSFAGDVIVVDVWVESQRRHAEEDTGSSSERDCVVALNDVVRQAVQDRSDARVSLVSTFDVLESFPQRHRAVHVPDGAHWAIGSEAVTAMTAFLCDALAHSLRRSAGVGGVGDADISGRGLCGSAATPLFAPAVL
jgi:hypothetical protein